jgi:DNA gyrase subunit A
MIAVDDPTATVMVVSEKGYGKRTDIEDYRVTNRGGKGVKTITITEKTGDLIAIKSVTDNDDLMIINKSGIVIRIVLSHLRVIGRATQGVRLINLKGNDAIASVAKIEHEDDPEEEVSEDVLITSATDVLPEDGEAATGEEAEAEEEEEEGEDDATEDDDAADEEK